MCLSCLVQGARSERASNHHLRVWLAATRRPLSLATRLSVGIDRLHARQTRSVTRSGSHLRSVTTISNTRRLHAYDIRGGAALMFSSFVIELADAHL